MARVTSNVGRKSQTSGRIPHIWFCTDVESLLKISSTDDTCSFSDTGKGDLASRVTSHVGRKSHPTGMLPYLVPVPFNFISRRRKSAVPSKTLDVV